MKTILYTLNSSGPKTPEIELFKPFINDQKTAYRFILVSTYLLENMQNNDLISQVDTLKRKSLVHLNSTNNILADFFYDHDVEFKMISSLGSIENVIPRILYKYPVDYIISIQNQHNKTQMFIKSLNNDFESAELTYHLT